MMQAFKDGRPIDDEFLTILDEDSVLSDSCVPNVRWHSDIRMVRFRWDHPGHRYKDSRLRRSVGGKVPEA